MSGVAIQKLVMSWDRSIMLLSYQSKPRTAGSKRRCIHFANRKHKHSLAHSSRLLRWTRRAAKEKAATVLAIAIAFVSIRSLSRLSV